MNRQLLINRLRAHMAHEDGPYVTCECGRVFGGTSDTPPGLQWARHMASVIYPETAGADKTVAAAS
jgi:hypothetical protein